MAYLEPQLSKQELDAMIQEFIQKKKENPSRIDRPLTYKIYNQLFNSKQRDVNACTCMDKDTDVKVVQYVEQHYKVEEPLPVVSSVKIDMSSMTAGGDVLTVFGEEEEIVATPKRKRSARSKKKTNEEEGSKTAE